MIDEAAKMLRKWGSCSSEFWWPRWTQLKALALGALESAYRAGYLTPYFLRACDTVIAMYLRSGTTTGTDAHRTCQVGE